MINQKGDDLANHIDVTAVWDPWLNVYGLGGDDVLIARGEGNRPTSLYGGGGDDILRATDLGAQRWSDVILDGGPGHDTMLGGSNDEVFVVSQVLDVVHDKSADDTDLVKTTLASYRLPENIENLSHLAGLDFKGYGNAGDNRISGDSGSDLLRGLAGNDTLSGGSDGNDTLVGSLGADELYCGGSVTLQYNRLADSRGPYGADEVSFMTAEDKIDLSRIDADASTTGRNEAFTFIGTEAFGDDATGQVRVERTGIRKTVMFISTDADAAAEMKIVFWGGTISFTDAMFIL